MVRTCSYGKFAGRVAASKNPIYLAQVWDPSRVILQKETPFFERILRLYYYYYYYYYYYVNLQGRDLWSRWEDNIRTNLEEIRINAENWVDSTQDRNYWKASGFHKPRS